MTLGTFPIDGDIRITVGETRPGHVGPVKWEWVGGPFVCLSEFEVMTEGYGHGARSGTEPRGLVAVGPYLVYVVGRANWAFGWYAVRADSWRGWWRATVWPLERALDAFCYRLIMTAWVWGLADHQINARASWRDVHALRWLADRLAA